MRGRFSLLTKSLDLLLLPQGGW